MVTKLLAQELPLRLSTFYKICLKSRPCQKCSTFAPTCGLHSPLLPPAWFIATRPSGWTQLGILPILPYDCCIMHIPTVAKMSSPCRHCSHPKVLCTSPRLRFIPSCSSTCSTTVLHPSKDGFQCQLVTYGILYIFQLWHPQPLWNIPIRCLQLSVIDSCSFEKEDCKQ